jgi:hypothetical protein
MKKTKKTEKTVYIGNRTFGKIEYEVLVKNIIEEIVEDMLEEAKANAVKSRNEVI